MRIPLRGSRISQGWAAAESRAGDSEAGRPVGRVGARGPLALHNTADGSGASGRVRSSRCQVSLKVKGAGNRKMGFKSLKRNG